MHRLHEVVIPTADGASVAERIPIKVPMLWDHELNEWLITPEAEELIETTKARHMGLLLPSELKALRERLGLSQQAIGELLQIGAKSWTRWESGGQRPSRSINLLLRALDSGMVSPHQLREINSSRADWSRQFRMLETAGTMPVAPVSLDVCREDQKPTAATVIPLRMPA